MHILFIITDYGSFNNFLGELALYMIMRNHQVSVICANSKTIDVVDKANYHQSGIQFHYVAFPRSFNVNTQLKTSLEIHRLVRGIHPDLVHIHFTTAMSTTLFAGRLPIYTMGTVHGLGYPSIKHPVKRQVFRFTETIMIKRLDEFWVLNQEDYALLYPQYGNKINIYSTAGIGCNTQLFQPIRSVQEKQDIRKSLNIAEKTVVYTFIGRFVHFKGFHLVAQAFLQIAEGSHTDVVLLLIGGKDDLHPSGLSKKEEEILFQHPQVRKIHFTHEVASYLAITDLMVFPSVKEGMPVSVMEALAMQVPVLTADTRGCNELVQHDVNGFRLGVNPSTEEVKTAMLRFYAGHKNNEYTFNFDYLPRSIARDDYVKEQYEIYVSSMSKKKEKQNN